MKNKDWRLKKMDDVMSEIFSPKGELQDIEAQIELVKKGKKSKIQHYLNRISLPFNFGKSDDDWLKILKFLRKQKIEEMKFLEKMKKEKKEFEKENGIKV